ncbi:MAG: MFS transporter [Candidatus Aenigmarchaeota archaeon]|nr:MFS transporter [Candidatus Aenigmarchaeota archaeon]
MPKKASREARELFTKGYTAPTERKEPKVIEKTSRKEPGQPPVKAAGDGAARKEKDPGHEVLVRGYLEERRKMKPELVNKSLHYSTIEGAFNSASSTIATAYVTPYAVALNASNAEVGVLNAAFHLAATLSQVPGALLTRRMSRKHIWAFSTIISRLAWVPVVLLPFLGGTSVVALIVCYAIYSFFNSLRTPAWTSLIGDIVPDEMRGRYFGRRNMIMGLASLATILAVGWLITTTGFQAIFALSIVLGLLSVAFFLRIYELPLRTGYHYRHAFSLLPRETLNSLKLNKNLVMFTLFLSGMSFATYVAAPFFAVYMLVDLKLSYLWYAVIVAFGALAGIGAQPHWGKLADRFGERKIIMLTGVMVCLIPFFYLFIRSPGEVLLVEGFSAFAWAGFELAGFNYILAVTPTEKRPTYVANHAFFKGLAIVLGTLAGGVLAETFKSSSIAWLYGLQIVFLISLVLRLLSLTFITKLGEVKPKEDVVPIRYVFWHAIGIEPAKGLVHSVAYTFRYPYELKKLKERMMRDIEHFEEQVKRKTRQSMDGFGGPG